MKNHPFEKECMQGKCRNCNKLRKALKTEFEKIKSDYYENNII